MEQKATTARPGYRTVFALAFAVALTVHLLIFSISPMVHVLMEEIEAAIVPVMAKRAKRVRRALRDRDISRARAETSTNESLGFVELYDRLLARQTQLLDELDKARERGDLDRWVAMTLQLAGDLRAMSTADQ